MEFTIPHERLSILLFIFAAPHRAAAAAAFKEILAKPGQARTPIEPRSILPRVSCKPIILLIHLQ
jgi:hypothetical protein